MKVKPSEVKAVKADQNLLFLLNGLLHLRNQKKNFCSVIDVLQKIAPEGVIRNFSKLPSLRAVSYSGLHAG